MRIYSEGGSLRPTPPFDLAKSLDFLGMFPPMRDDQTLEESSLTRAISVEGRTVVFQLRATGTMKQPRVKYTLFSEDSFSPSTREVVADRISFFLSLDDDLRPFYRIAQEDPDFLPIMQRLYGLHHVKFLTPFESACWAILLQHNLMSLALITKRALVQKYGGKLEVGGRTYWAFPEPSRLADASREDLLELVRNQRRVDYLVEVARAFSSVDEEFLRTAEYDVVEGWLRQTRGIGEWSSKLILLRGLGRMEKLAIGKRLLAAASRFYGHGSRIGLGQLNELAERYGPCKGYWAYYLRTASGPEMNS